MNVNKQQEIILSYITAYNNFDIPGMLENLHPEVKFENVTNGQVTLNIIGLKAFEQQALQAKTLFKERNQKVTDWSFNQNKVQVTIDYQGVLAVDLPNGLSAGSSMELQGKSIFTFKENKIIHLRDEA